MLVEEGVGEERLAMTSRIRPYALGAVCFAVLVAACGNDNSSTTPPPEENEAGSGNVIVETYPPALGPEDCVASVEDLKLSQPDKAAVWGGLVLLEFTVPGAKLRSFEVQMFDPSLEAWTSSYVGQDAFGQREDGSYFMAVSPAWNEATKDQELRLRIRPTQNGCPEGDWSETGGFTAGDPLLGTSWSAEIPSELFNSQLRLQRSTILGDPLPGSDVVVDATMNMTFGEEGAFSQTVSLALQTGTGLAYDGCTVDLTFSGTYQLLMRDQYGSLSLALSQQELSAFDSVCDLPTLEEMEISLEQAFMGSLEGFTQGVSINYVPTIHATPSSPTWQSNFGQVFQQLTQFMNYTTADEQGGFTGYIYPLEVELTQE